MFEVGDRVIFNPQDDDDYHWGVVESDMKEGKKYTVCKAGPVTLRVATSLGSSYLISHKSFTYAKLSNEDRMKKRMEELNV